MQLVPLENMTERSLRELARHDTVEDADRDVVLTVTGVEMRWIVLAIQDCDDNTQETANFRHRSILAQTPPDPPNE